jgi:tRNA U34 5-carboxymethylaminomethyl modifying enzyme MnmG/GidA
VDCSQQRAGAGGPGICDAALHARRRLGSISGQATHQRRGQADRGEYRQVARDVTEAVDSRRFEAERKCRLSEQRGDITSILILEPVSAAE